MEMSVEMTEEQKNQAIQMALDAANKQFGKGTINILGEMEIEPVPVISTGSIALDQALGVGGFPRGKIIEIYGPESSGKTTLTLHAIAEAQKAGGKCVFIDAEHALDLGYAQNLGVKTEELVLAQPSSGEQALQLVSLMTKSGGIDLIVVDSVAALTPQAELEGEIGDSHVGRQARLMSQALRMLTGVAERTNTTIVFINQIRMKIGVMFGNPETTPGGNALKFYSSVRLDIRRVGAVKEGTEVIGNETRIKVVKNKVAPPFRVADTRIRYGTGFDTIHEVTQVGVKAGVIVKSGSWFSFPDGTKIGQGANGVQRYFEEHPDELERIKAECINPTQPEE